MEEIVPISELSKMAVSQLGRYLYLRKWEISAKIKEKFSAASDNFWWAVSNAVKRSRDNNLLGAPEYNGILLPHGTRFVFRKGHKTVFVIEQAPQVRPINFSYQLVSWQHSPEGPIKTTFQLAFPYVIFIFVFNDADKKEINSERIMWSYFSNSPLKSIRQSLYDNFLPNNNRGRICLPHLAAEFSRQRTYAGIIDTSIEHYWRSAFTDHHHEMENFERVMSSRKGLWSLWEWERRTLENPDFILNIHSGNELTLKEIIDELLDDTDRITANEIARIFKMIYNNERQAQLDKVDQYLRSLDLPADLQMKLTEEIKAIVMEWETALLTIIKKGDKKNRRRRLVKRVRGFFDGLLENAPTTKGGEK